MWGAVVFCGYFLLPCDYGVRAFLTCCPTTVHLAIPASRGIKIFALTSAIAKVGGKGG